MLYKTDLEGDIDRGSTSYYIDYIFLLFDTGSEILSCYPFKRDSCVLSPLYPCSVGVSAHDLYVCKTTELGIIMPNPTSFPLGLWRLFFSMSSGITCTHGKVWSQAGLFSVLKVTFFLCLNACEIFFLLDSGTPLAYALVLTVTTFPEMLCMPFPSFLGAIFPQF